MYYQMLSQMVDSIDIAGIQYIQLVDGQWKLAETP